VPKLDLPEGFEAGPQFTISPKNKKQKQWKKFNKKK